MLTSKIQSLKDLKKSNGFLVIDLNREIFFKKIHISLALPSNPLIIQKVSDNLYFCFQLS